MIRNIESSPLQIMRKLLILLLLSSWSLQAQNKSGITGKPDTSFTNYSALRMVSKQDPTIRLAVFQSSKSKVQSSVYKVIGARKLMVDEYAISSRKLPTLVFFHGGGWRTGHRSQHIPLAKALADRGGIHAGQGSGRAGDSAGGGHRAGCAGGLQECCCHQSGNGVLWQ